MEFPTERRAEPRLEFRTESRLESRTERRAEYRSELPLELRLELPPPVTGGLELWALQIDDWRLAIEGS